VADEEGRVFEHLARQTLPPPPLYIVGLCGLARCLVPIGSVSAHEAILILILIHGRWTQRSGRRRVYPRSRMLPTPTTSCNVGEIILICYAVAAAAAAAVAADDYL